MSTKVRYIGLDVHKETIAKILASSLAPLVRSLMVLRGVATVTASVFAAEIGDFRRFRSAKHFMAYVGLTSTEDSSGERVRRGAITKCGNRHVRHLLVEAAQHYRRRGTGAGRLCLGDRKGGCGGMTEEAHWFHWKIFNNPQ